MVRHLHLTDSDLLQFTIHLDGVVDEEAPVVPVFRVKGHSQKAPLIPQPRRGHHLPAHVQEGLLQPAAVPQVNPHKPHLLRDKHPVCVVSTVQHQDGVPQVIGHLCQTQLQTAAGVLHHLAQVTVQARAVQDFGVAVVLVRQVHHAAERGHVPLTGLLQQLVLCQILHNMSACGVKLLTVAEAQAWELSDRSVGVLRIEQVGRIRGALLQGTTDAGLNFSLFVSLIEFLLA